MKSISNHFKNAEVSKFLANNFGDKERKAFVSNVIALTEADPKLQKCDPGSLMKCAMNATALNLPLNKNLGYAYIVPYNNVPQFQMGYKGFIQLAIRTGQYKTINACEVREGEIKRNKFTGAIEFLEEKEEGKIVGYLAFIELLNGFQQSLYMSTKEVQAHAKKYSKVFARYGNGLWKDEFHLMAKKTVLKLLLNRYGVLSTEMQNAIQIDQADSEGNYIDNPTSRQVEVEVLKQAEPEDEKPKVLNLSDL